MTEIIDAHTGELVTAADLVPYEPRQQVTLFGTNDPAAVVEAATAVSRPLAAKVEEQKLYKTISGKRHILVEGWQLLGSMMGVFAVPDGDPEPIELDGSWGFKARMKAVTRNGDVVGGGTSYCMRSEDRWRNADVYALASMAQTRATSKALKGPLGFVMKLAGFESTPADEMPEPPPKAAPKKDKAAAMRTRIKELSVEADTARGEMKTADEIDAAIKATWNTTLAKLEESKLAILGTDLKEWVEGGCVGEFKVVPF